MRAALNTWLRVGLLGLAFLVLAGQGLAQSGTGTGADKKDEFGTPITGGKEKPGLQSIALRLGIYQKDDAGSGNSAGNPFLDEDLTVIEPVMIFDWGLDERSAITLTGSFDWVSSASIDRLDDKTRYPASQQSGASGDYYVGVDTAYRYHWDDFTRVGAHLDISKEYDYLSIGLGGDLAWSSPDGNTNQSLALNGYFDDVTLIRFNGVEDGNDSRTSLATTYRYDRVLSGSSQMQLGGTLSLQSGFLSTPYNGVFIESGGTATEVGEVLPDSRTRMSLFGSYRRWFYEGGAGEIASRLYNDDWGITGISLEPRWYQKVGDSLLMRFRYRYYDQSGSDYSGRFAASEKYMTQDSDLAEFDSHTFGMRLIGYRDGRQGWDAGIDYVMRSDELDHIIASFGYLWTF